MLRQFHPNGMSKEKKLAGAKFVRERNKWLVRGDMQKLVAKPEVLRNLDQHREFRPSTLMHERLHPAFVVVLSIVAVHFILAFMLLIQWAETALSPHIAFTVLIGLACLLFGLLVVTSIKTVQRTRIAGLTTNDYLLALLRTCQHLPALASTSHIYRTHLHRRTLDTNHLSLRVAQRI